MQPIGIVVFSKAVVDVFVVVVVVVLVQVSVSLLGPGHGEPFEDGGGFVQDLTLVVEPPLHDDQLPHVLHSPFTGCWPILYLHMQAQVLSAGHFLFFSTHLPLRNIPWLLQFWLHDQFLHSSLVTKQS